MEPRLSGERRMVVVLVMAVDSWWGVLLCVWPKSWGRSLALILMLQATVGSGDGNRSSHSAASVRGSTQQAARPGRDTQIDTRVKCGNMDRLLKVVLLVVSLAATGSSFRCERENLWGSTQYFSCPEPGDNPNDVYCCGFGDNKFCCSSQAQEEILEEFFDNLPTILGVIAAIIITIIVLCIVCCCCCPFCLLYKRRNHGTVRNPANPEVSVMQPLQGQPQPYPSQPYPAAPQQQAPYPTQPMAMQAAPAPYPPQPYPPTGYPGEQPPMYTEKQPPPYNPTY